MDLQYIFLMTLLHLGLILFSCDKRIVKMICLLQSYRQFLLKSQYLNHEM